MELSVLWAELFWPLIRLIFFVSFGLFIAIFIEALNWTHGVAKLATPLVRMGNLKDVSGASFSMAFFSGVAANSMLAEYYEQGKLSKKELVLSNLFNSLPTYFLHLPTVFFITLPFLGAAAVVYVGLTFFAAIFRTFFIAFLGKILLPKNKDNCITCELGEQKKKSWREVWQKALKRFKKRIRQILLFTIPIYVFIFILKQWGMFIWLQDLLADNAGLFSFLPPEALGIVIFHVVAEFTAGLAAAGALLQAGNLDIRDVVLALLLGNVLSAPMRAFRHQFPYYAGIFKPAIAMRLIVYNQALRTISIILVGVAFYFYGDILISWIQLVNFRLPDFK